MAKRESLRDKRPDGAFLALPLIVLRSPQWAALRPDAAKALLDLLGQYTAKNNGDLSAHWALMTARGWRSKDRLARALRDLEAGGWIVRTRQGGSHRPTLWGCTIYALDPMAKLEIGADEWQRSHRGLWARTAPVVPTVWRRFALVDGANSGTLSAPVAGAKLPASDRPSGRTSTLAPDFAPIAGPIKADSAEVRPGGRSPSKKLPSVGADLDHPTPPPSASPSGLPLTPGHAAAIAKTDRRLARTARAKARQQAQAATHAAGRETLQ